MAATISIPLTFGQFPRFREAVKEYCRNADTYAAYLDRSILYRQVSGLAAPEWKNAVKGGFNAPVTKRAPLQMPTRRSA